MYWLPWLQLTRWLCVQSSTQLHPELRVFTAQVRHVLHYNRKLAAAQGHGDDLLDVLRYEHLQGVAEVLAVVVMRREQQDDLESGSQFRDDEVGPLYARHLQLFVNEKEAEVFEVTEQRLPVDAHHVLARLRVAGIDDHHLS